MKNSWAPEVHFPAEYTKRASLIHYASLVRFHLMDEKRRLKAYFIQDLSWSGGTASCTSHQTLNLTLLCGRAVGASLPHTPSCLDLQTSGRVIAPGTGQCPLGAVQECGSVKCHGPALGCSSAPGTCKAELQERKEALIQTSHLSNSYGIPHKYLVNRAVSFQFSNIFTSLRHC